MLRSNEAYGWHFQYLTVIGLALSTLTFAVALLADLTLSARLFLVKNLLSICSAPMEVLISVLYWSLRMWYRTGLIFQCTLASPQAGLLFRWILELISYRSADIGFHAVPAIVLLIDLLLLSPPWTISIVPALGLSSTIALSYWVWIERCYKYNGWYPYPIFEQVRFEGRVGLFLMSAIVMALSTATLQWLYGRVNGFGTASKPKARPGALKQNGTSKQNGGL
ncbi:UPF0641 membrane protein PJ4664.05 [Aspergillus lentulus]|uniref:UPF0641 membrane protein PJ4664.05 n=1 Tax=Aspergillus lentulus TaxID=293939 RepID=A0AAN4TF69_ASPLE|nr:UPF0641 membrane protein PJ4664.05 [Aspergillus lentulus]